MGSPFYVWLTCDLLNPTARQPLASPRPPPDFMAVVCLPTRATKALAMFGHCVSNRQDPQLRAHPKSSEHRLCFTILFVHVRRLKTVGLSVWLHVDFCEKRHPPVGVAFFGPNVSDRLTPLKRETIG